MAIGECTRFVFLDDNSLSFDPKISGSELTMGVQEVELSADDIFLIGGFYAEQKNLKPILDAINAVKEENDVPLWLPVKWNLKDNQLTRFYREHNEQDALDRLFEKSTQVRGGFLDILDRFNCNVICSGVGRIQDSVERVDFYQMALANILQRLGYDCEKSSNLEFPRLMVISDWPERQFERKLFSTYSLGYHFGRDEHERKYYSGPLCDLGTYPDLYCGKTVYSPYLQLADILVGALHCLFKWCFKDTDLQLVQQTFPKIEPFFRRDAAGNYIGRGLVVAPRDVKRRLVQRLHVLKENHLK